MMQTKSDSLDRLAAGLGRRKNFRVRTAIVAHYRLDGDPGDGEVYVSNLGIGGARADFPAEIPAASTLTIILPPLLDPEAGPRGLELPCEVAWTTARVGEGPVPTGLQFHRLDETTRQKLSLYLARLIG